MKKTAFIILFALIFSCFAGFAVNAEELKAEPSGAYLKYTIDVNKPEDENLAYHFMTILRNIDYVIKEGDLLMYDVYSYIDEPGWGAIDGEISGVGSIRDSGLRDLEGGSVHTGADLSANVYDQWYRRAILLGVDEIDSDKPTVGQTLRTFQIAMHPSVSDNDYQGIVLYDNIVIVNSGEIQYVIFQDEGDLDPDSFRLSHRQGAAGTLEVLVFTPEEEQGFKDAAERKIQEEIAREASREAAREQASIEASERESQRQAESEAAAAAATDAINELAADGGSAGGSSGSGNGPSTGLIIGIIAGSTALAGAVIVIIGINKKKKG